MPYEEKRAWIMVFVSVTAYAVYAALVLGRADGTALTEVSYAATMLWSIGGAILASIVLNIAVAMASAQKNLKDQRDHEIHQVSQYIGQSFVVIGGVSALGMALAEVDYFWIANVIYLTFLLSAILGSIAKIVAYRRGFQLW
jgi:hypothetical protein